MAKSDAAARAAGRERDLSVRGHAADVAALAQDPQDVADAVKGSRAGQMVAFEDRTLVLQDRLALRLDLMFENAHANLSRAQEAAERRSFRTTNSSPSALTAWGKKLFAEAEGTGLAGLMAKAPIHVPSQPRNMGQKPQYRS
jgi:hypothetical protein